MIGLDRDALWLNLRNIRDCTLRLTAGVIAGVCLLR